VKISLLEVSSEIFPFLKDCDKELQNQGETTNDFGNRGKESFKGGVGTTGHQKLKDNGGETRLNRFL